MNFSRFTVVAVLVALVIGMVLGCAYLGNPALAQQAQAQPGQFTSAGRYQVSAYAGSTPDGLGHGCYVLDTATGQVWHARLGGEAQKVSAQLP